MERRVLWASRHPLDEEARKALVSLFGECQVETREVLWPSDFDGSCALLDSLRQEFWVVAGVFPAQAIEAICASLGEWEKSPATLGMVAIISPVSIPVTEPEQRKIRPFRFVRWALLWLADPVR